MSNFEVVLNHLIANSGFCEQYTIKKVEGYDLVFQKDSFVEDAIIRFASLMERSEDNNKPIFIFLLTKDFVRHSPYQLPGLLNLSLHLFTLGLVPFYGPDWVSMTVLRKEMSSPVVEFKRTKKAASTWSWGFFKWTEDRQSFEQGTERNIERLYEASLSHLLTQ